MGASDHFKKNILITGGTSGLGFELAKQFLDKGHSVLVTGRTPNKRFLSYQNFEFYRIDFCNLSEVAQFGYRIIQNKRHFDYIICNAGTLSPPSFCLTNDGNEYTFQVNFLSHFLLNQIIIPGKSVPNPMVIISVISPALRLGKLDTDQNMSANNYSRVKAYANSKLYLALMSRFLSDEYNNPVISSFSFDPGVFSSGIYRSQRKWFHHAYHLGSPFLKNPSGIAMKLIELLESGNLVSGVTYKRSGKMSRIPFFNHKEESVFWKSCLKKIEPFIQRRG